jgi:hypothetical protein
MLNPVAKKRQCQVPMKWGGCAQYFLFRRRIWNNKWYYRGLFHVDWIKFTG